MKISEIKDPAVRELAEKRKKEYPTPDRNKTTFGFDWHTTPEGDRFWRDVLGGKNVSDYKSYPNPLIIDSETYQIKFKWSKAKKKDLTKLKKADLIKEVKRQVKK